MPLIDASGIKLNYEISGEGDPLLLIMGFGMPGAAWMPLLPFFSGFKCICFDNRGTGLSDKPEGPYTVPEMADDASNLLRAIGIDRARVYGISMGGMIAQELILRHPDQVSQVILGCMYGPSPVRKASALIVLTIRLRACIRPLDEAPSASGHDGNPHVFAYSTTSASWALHPCQVWKTPVRPVRHHLTDNLRNSLASFSRRRSSG